MEWRNTTNLLQQVANAKDCEMSVSAKDSGSRSQGGRHDIIQELSCRIIDWLWSANKNTACISTPVSQTKMKVVMVTAK